MRYAHILMTVFATASRVMLLPTRRSKYIAHMRLNNRHILRLVRPRLHDVLRFRAPGARARFRQVDEHNCDLFAKRNIRMTQRASSPTKRNDSVNHILPSSGRQKTPKPANANKATKGIPSTVHQLLILTEDIVAVGCGTHNSAICHRSSPQLHIFSVAEILARPVAGNP